MTLQLLLDRLGRLDVEVRLAGDRLHVNAPEGVLTPELQDEIRAQRDELVAFLRRAERARAAPSMIVLQPEGTRPPVFGVPGHHGDVFGFLPLVRALGKEQPFVAYQPPGMTGEDEPLTQIEDLAEHFVEELRAFQPDGPYRLAGHCTGRLVAFEAAIRLVLQGQAVASLALFGTSAPTSNRLARRALALPVRALNRTLRVLRGGADVGSSEPELDTEVRRRMERVTTAAARRYLGGRYPGDLTLYIPSRNWRGLVCERYLDWARYCAGELRVHAGPPEGAHLTMLRDPFAARVAERLRAELA